MTGNSPTLQSIRAFADTSGLSAYEVRRRIKAGQLPFMRIGTKYFVDVPAALDLLHDEARSNVR